MTINHVKRLRISRGGQVSVPAEVRKRWGTQHVVAEDHGDYIVMRPTADDPIEAAAGAFAKYMTPDSPTAAEAMAELRREEAEIEERKWGHLGPA